MLLTVKGWVMVELSKEEQKEVLKEALDEWLDKQFAKFGRWTLAGVLSMALAGSMYIWTHTKGFGG